MNTSTRVMRRSGMRIKLNRRAQKNLPLFLLAAVAWAVVFWVAYRNFDKEFPPYATISRGPVEARIMADKTDPARLKQMVNLLTASEVGAWARYRAEKPIVQCTVTPITNARYEASCKFPRDGYTLVKPQQLANDQEVKQLLWDLHRDATAMPIIEPIGPAIRKKLIEA